MKIEVTVKTQARNPGVERLADGSCVVRVKEPAREGRANEAVIEAVARHFGVPRRSVTILRGHTARRKFLEVVLPKTA